MENGKLKIEIESDDLTLLWKEFSNIQAAEDLIVDEESLLRFIDWLKTRNPEDAWS